MYYLTYSPCNSFTKSVDVKISHVYYQFGDLESNTTIIFPVSMYFITDLVI